jgi:hypothetical protein
VRWFAGLGPYNLHVADMNEDGHPDLAVLYGANAVTPASPPQAVAVLLNNGDGTFQPPRSYEIGANTVGIAVGDLNHDGHPDIVASSNGLNSVVTLLGNGDGTFTSGPRQALSRPGLPTLADLNEDGILDLAIEHGNNGGLDDSVAVMLGAGNGAFAPHVEWSLIGANDVAGFADFDHDGHLDLALETAGRSLSVWSGHGDGSFSPPATDFGLGSYASYLVIADFNGDQLPDVIAGNEFMDDLQLLLNRTVTPPAAVFEPPSPRLSLSLGIAPVPSRGDRLLVAFTLPSRERAHLELFDVAGRRIVSHEVTALGAGLHRIDLAAGRAFRPGVYLLRLTQSGRAVTARAVVVE